MYVVAVTLLTWLQYQYQTLTLPPLRLNGRHAIRDKRNTNGFISTFTGAASATYPAAGNYINPVGAKFPTSDEDDSHSGQGITVEKMTITSNM
ncbi:hypothetical protein C0991_006083 [Blastosporella zonata]|nr:hypothetical protein C0991_006083 [Blastosporella zonata]